MEEQDVELVKQIIKDELGPALEVEGKRIEANVIASQHAFQEEIRHEVRKDHAENRTRFQQNYEVSSKAAASSEFILRRMDKQDRDIEGIRGLMLQLVSEVKTWAGRREGEEAADAKHDATSEKRMGWLWKVGAAVASGSVYRWLATVFHWWGGKK